MTLSKASGTWSVTNLPKPDRWTAGGGLTPPPWQPQPDSGLTPPHLEQATTPYSLITKLAKLDSIVRQGGGRGVPAKLYFHITALNPRDAEVVVDTSMEVTQRGGVEDLTGQRIYDCFCGHVRDPRVTPAAGVPLWAAPHVATGDLLAVDWFCPQCGHKMQTACGPWQMGRFRGTDVHHCETMGMSVCTSLDHIISCTGDRLEGHFWRSPDAVVPSVA